MSARARSAEISLDRCICSLQLSRAVPANTREGRPVASGGEVEFLNKGVDRPCPHRSSPPGTRETAFDSQLRTLAGLLFEFGEEINDRGTVWPAPKHSAFVDVTVMQQLDAIYSCMDLPHAEMNWVSEQPVRCEEGAPSCRPMQGIVRIGLPPAPDEQDWRVHQR
jgi:hypothetical protein